jgi:hypothetical protein
MTTGSVSFDRIADRYDATRGGLERGRLLARSIAPHLHPGPVLEVGVGTGAVSSGIDDLGHRVIGVDLSLPMLARAVERLGARVAAADGHHLPVPDGAVPNVVLVWVLHLVGDPESVLAETVRARWPPAGASPPSRRAASGSPTRSAPSSPRCTWGCARTVTVRSDSSVLPKPPAWRSRAGTSRRPTSRAPHPRSRRSASSRGPDPRCGTCPTTAGWRSSSRPSLRCVPSRIRRRRAAAATTTRSSSSSCPDHRRRRQRMGRARGESGPARSDRDVRRCAGSGRRPRTARR